MNYAGSAPFVEFTCGRQTESQAVEPLIREQCYSALTRERPKPINPTPKTTFPMTCPATPSDVAPNTGIKITPAPVASAAHRGRIFACEMLTANKSQPNAKSATPEANPAVMSADLPRTRKVSGLVWATARSTNRLDHSAANNRLVPTNATKKATVPNIPETLLWLRCIPRLPRRRRRAITSAADKRSK